MLHRNRRVGRIVGLSAVVVYLIAWMSPSALADTGQYQFWTRGQSLSSSSVYVIVKGSQNPDGASTTQRLINYEQSFVLNATEASYARAQGWLALTCAGAEIHPSNSAGTLIDATDPAALDWRSSAIAAETTATGRYGTYLDTLRPIFPDSFYDGVPCEVELDHAAGETAWRGGSIDLVNAVRSKTNGEMVIANGSGMQSGKSYAANQTAVDEFLSLARPEGVQIEQFARNASAVPLDASFMRTLGSRGIITFAKCAGKAKNCRTAFNDGLNGSAYMTIPLA